MKQGDLILVVEDSILLAGIFKTVLEEAGYEVIVANSGEAATEIIANSDKHLAMLVTDLGLAGDADGWDVAREARTTDAGVPIIYLTGAISEDWIGADAPKSLMMQKPLMAEELIAAVAEFPGRMIGNHPDSLSDRVERLQFKLGKAEERNRKLEKSAKALAVRQSAATRGEEIALAASRNETKVGQADLLASETALASSQEQTKHGAAELLASEVALASSQAETKVGLADLLASAAALATSRAETKISLSDLLASAAALAISRAETKTGQTDLLASEIANKGLVVANSLLITNEAALEQIVEQRTAALTRELEEHRIAEEALHQGEKLRALGQLTGGIAHDFNNILQLVFSTTAFLRSPDLTSARRLELIDGLENAAALAGQITSRLVSFARKKVLSPQSCDINKVLAGMNELLLPTLGAKIVLETVMAPDLWPVIADQSQLEVALLNLASNARDAMLPDGGVFRLTTSNVVLPATSNHPAGEHVCLMISDTGPGMPADVVEHAFEPFFTTKPRGKGTGLGLAQVWGFAKQSGGDVSISTSEGGTSFSLHFPRPTATALAASGAPITEAEETTPKLAGIRQTVLVVEDNQDLQGLTVSLLRQLGYDTLSAENAAEALLIIASNEKVDAVFSDIVMPGDMNGVELAETLFRSHPNLPVTLATGYSEFLIDHPAPKSVEVLAKPYRINELTGAIRRSFQKAQVYATFH